jgi:hypothetical protein
LRQPRRLGRYRRPPAGSARGEEGSSSLAMSDRQQRAPGVTSRTEPGPSSMCHERLSQDAPCHCSQALCPQKALCARQRGVIRRVGTSGSGPGGTSPEAHMQA